jgi:hypothetical protein
MLAGAGIMIVVGEQLCVKREMNEGLAVPAAPASVDGENSVDDVEMSALIERDDQSR